LPVVLPLSSGPRSGVAAVRSRARALRAARDVDRARRSHPAARGALCRARCGARARRAHARERRRRGAGAALDGGRERPAPLRGGAFMSALARVQGDFQDHLLRGGAAVEAHALGTARVPVATRLGVYAGAYRSRLAEALENSYPALAKLLGEADFH